MVGIFAVIIVMVVVNLLMVFAILKSAGQLEGTIKKYFIAHMGDEGVRRDLAQSMENASVPTASTAVTPASVEQETGKAKASESASEAGAAIAMQAMYLDASQYKNASFKEDYRAVRRMDLLNKEEALNNVVEIQDKAGIAKSGFSELAELLDYDTAFRMSSLDPETQLKVLQESLTENQQGILYSYVETAGGCFDILDFYGFISEQAKMDEDIYYIYKAKGAADPIAADKKICSVEDDSITEGMKIVYKNKLYDYSV